LEKDKKIKIFIINFIEYIDIHIIGRVVD
jgi:hypothetical protein